MLINLTNHPSRSWDDLQKKAAASFGKTVDLLFPAISPKAETAEILTLAEQYRQEITEILSEKNEQHAVHVMGELTFCFAITALLQQDQIRCVASTSARQTTENSDGTKTIRFNFVRFRDYPQLNLLK